MKKKSGAGAGKKFAGSPALIRGHSIGRSNILFLSIFVLLYYLSFDMHEDIVLLKTRNSGSFKV